MLSIRQVEDAMNCSDLLRPSPDLRAHSFPACFEGRTRVLQEDGGAQWCAQPAGSCFALSSGADGVVRLWDAMAASSASQPHLELPSLGEGGGVLSMHVWTAGRGATPQSGTPTRLVCGLEDGRFVQWETGEAR